MTDGNPARSESGGEECTPVGAGRRVTAIAAEINVA
jgi:hypothetical protein